MTSSPSRILSLVAGVLLAVAVAMLSGCQTAGPDPAVAAEWARLDQGNNGFAGTIQPFTIPVTVRYAPVAYAGHQSQISESFGAGTSRSEWDLKGTIVSSGDALVWDESYFFTSVSLTAPTYAVRQQMDSRGRVSRAEASFPALEGRTLTAEQNQFIQAIKEWTESVQTDVGYPAGAVAAGDALLTSADVARLLGQTLGAGDLADNTLGSRIAGLTFVGSRRALVVTLGGAATLRSGPDVLTMTMRGYMLVDLATGLTVEELVGTSVGGNAGGAAVAARSVQRTQRTIN